MYGEKQYPYTTERSLLFFCKYGFTELHRCERTNDMVQFKAQHNVCRKRCSPKPSSFCVIKFFYSVLLLQIQLPTAPVKNIRSGMPNHVSLNAHKYSAIILFTLAQTEKHFLLNLRKCLAQKHSHRKQNTSGTDL